MSGEVQQAEQERFDQFEALLAQQGPPVELPLIHTFTPGLYTRTIFMPKDTLVTSKIHKTRHQFIISQGSVSVYNLLTKEVETFHAPHHGITEPGTRRFLWVHEDTIWTTMHPTNETDVDVIESQIIEPHNNSFIQ